MNIAVTLPVFWSTNETFTASDGQQLPDFDKCPIREMTFYNVENIAPFYFEGTSGVQREWCLLQSAGREYIVASPVGKVHRDIIMSRLDV